MKRILITGSHGFVGNHLTRYLLDNTDWEIIGLDSFRHSGDPLRTHDDPRYQVFCHDLNAPIGGRLSDKIGRVNYIINLASCSDVDLSIKDPIWVWENNTRLIGNILEYARLQKLRDLEAFIQCSSDEVFGPAFPGDFHREWDTIRPSNPYSASKAAQEALCISYWRTYGLPLIITNCFAGDMRLMTEHGLRGRDEISVGDKVWTLNDNEEMVLTEILEVIHREPPDKMVEISTPKVNQLVTPDHRMMVREPHGRPIKYGPIVERTAQELLTLPWRRRIPTTGNWSGQPMPHDKIVGGATPEDMAAIYGWYVSEGFYVKDENTVCFGAGSDKQRKTLTDLLAPLGRGYVNGTSVRIANKQLRNIAPLFGTYAANKFVPDFIKNLSRDLLRIFLDAAIDGDGSRYRTKLAWATVYYTKSRQLAEDMAEVGMKCGYAVRICRRKTWNPMRTILGESFIVRFRNPEADIEKRNVREVTPTGDVWCVRTKAGRVFVERGGIFSLSGQCMNMVGETQEPVKFIPKIIGALVRDEAVVIHGTPTNVGSRMYLDAKNLADAWLFILRNVQPNGYSGGEQMPSRYNIVGQEEVTNLELARRVADIMGKKLKFRYEDFHLTRPGHDRRYALDGGEIQRLGWKHPIPLDETLRRVVQWSMDNPMWLK